MGLQIRQKLSSLGPLLAFDAKVRQATRPWTLLFHQCVLGQLQRLKTAADKAVAKDAEAAAENANVKLFAALAKLILETVPGDPSKDEFRQGNTMGADYRHWRRAKFGRRFRLSFRYDSQSKVIIYAWVNDDKTLHTAGQAFVAYRKRGGLKTA